MIYSTVEPKTMTSINYAAVWMDVCSQRGDLIQPKQGKYSLLQ